MFIKFTTFSVYEGGRTTGRQHGPRPCGLKGFRVFLCHQCSGIILEGQLSSLPLLSDGGCWMYHTISLLTYPERGTEFPGAPGWLRR